MAAQQEVKLIIEAINRTDAAFAELKKGLADLQAGVQKTSVDLGILGGGATKAAGAFLVWKAAIDRVLGPLKSAFEAARSAVDEYNIAVTKTAALVTGMMVKDDRSLGERYSEAKSYAEGLAIALEDIDKRTLLTARDLQDITEEMAKQGVFLDYNNKKQVAGFEALANALAVISAGAPNRQIQLRQEARALLQGEVNVNSQLAQILQAQVGNLEEQIVLHKRQGDLLEWLGGQLQGFAAASGDIQATWEAVRTSLNTLWKQVIRGGLGPAFEAIVSLSKRLSEWASAHKDDIQSGILGAWRAVGGIVDTVGNLFRGLGGDLAPLKDLVITIAEGWRAIATVYLPPLAGLIGDITKPLFDMLRTLGNIGRVAALIMAGDFSAADRAFQDMKKSWKDWQESSTRVVSGKVLDTYMDDFSRRLIEYEKAWEPGKAKRSAGVPPTSKPKTDKEKAEAQAAAEAWLKNEIAAIKRREAEAIASLNIQEAQAEKNRKSGLISDLELTEEKRRIAEEEGRARILAVDQEIAAQKKLMAMKAGNYKDSREQLKEEAAIRAQVTQLEAERGKIAAEGKVKGLRFDTEEIEQAKKDYEDWLKTQHDAEKYTKDQASRLKAIREGEINDRIAALDLAEKEGKAHVETLEERVRLMKELEEIQREFLKSIDRTKDPTGWNTQREKINETQKKLAEVTRETQMKDPLGAAKLSLKDYANSAKESGKQIYEAVSKSLNQLEDKLVDFCKTGKLSFKDMVDAIASDLLRIAIRTQVTGPLAGALGLEGYHSGGIVGREGRSVSISIVRPDFLPRYHSGIGPDERLAVLRTDEGVFTAGQMRALGAAIRGGNTNINVPVTVDGKNKRLSSDLRRNIERVVEDTIRRHM